MFFCNGWNLDLFAANFQSNAWKVNKTQEGICSYVENLEQLYFHFIKVGFCFPLY